MLKGKSAKLKQRLNSSGDGRGISFGMASGAHQSIKLHGSPSNGAVQFPIPAGTSGSIVDETDTDVVVRFSWSERGNQYSHQTATILIAKGALGGICEVS